MRRDSVAAAALGAFDVYRTLHHAMWCDELQAFMLAAGGPSLGLLFHRLRYESHPPLWHVLLWIPTRFTANPVAMQVLHAALALGVWWLVWRFAPFPPAENRGAGAPPRAAPRIVSFEDWVVDRFGRRLHETFFAGYTEKVWGIPCTRIGAEWASQRIKARASAARS